MRKPTLAIVALLVGLLLSGVACLRHMTPENVAKAYVTALRESNLDAFRKLFEPVRQDMITTAMFNKIKVRNMEILNVKAPYIDVSYTLAIDDEVYQEAGSLYLLPDSHIKYEPVFMPHPALALRGILEQMQSPNLTARTSAAATLKSWKLPDFEFNPNGSETAQLKSTDAFEVWIGKNAATYDGGDTKIPLSHLDQQRL